MDTQNKDNIKFICDFMLGKLAKYLRMCGYDTKFIKNISDEKLLTLALKENRILLTRDNALLLRKLIKDKSLIAILVKEDNIKKQLLQLKNQLNLSIDINLLRCINCNGILKEIKKEEIKSLVPEYVYNTQEKFLFCPRCKKVYWNGTHIKKMRDFFKEINN